MSTSASPGSNTTRKSGHRLRDFWARVTEGLELNQLWGQFKSDAQASYGLYSKDVDWEVISREKSRMKRGLLSVWAMFQALLMKLTPARRVLLLIAVVLLAVQPDVRWGNENVKLSLQGFGATILFLLLALELADRVTMKRDLEIAREIQGMLVPEKPPKVPGVDLAFSTRPQNTVAGDYYDAFLRPNTGRLLVVVADVAGKSVPAALLMATFQASLQALAAMPGTLDEIVAGLNGYACAHSLGGMRFTTAFLAELDLATRALTYINAGHNAPVLRHESGRIERLDVGGLPLGIVADGSYPSGTAALEPGDLLVVFTDGAVEAVNGEGEEYGEPRLLARIDAAPGDGAAVTLKHLMADVDGFVGAARQHDDITCLVMRAVASAS